MEGAALRGAIFGMRMIVIKSRAIADDKIAFNLRKSQLPLNILSEVLGLIKILSQFLHVETSHIRVGIFASIVPPHQHTRLGNASHESD
jgi:hypothetical protein